MNWVVFPIPKPQTTLQRPMCVETFQFTCSLLRPLARGNPSTDGRPPGLGGLTMAGIDRRQREAYRERLIERSHKIMKECGIDPPIIVEAVREAIADFFVRPRRKLLEQ